MKRLKFKVYLLFGTVCFLTFGCPSLFAQKTVLDNPNALEGQIIVDPQNPEWFKYKGGKHLFICGAGDPENFLYRGTRNADGTRDGDQMQLINKMKGTGANSIHAIAFRSKNYGGDGDITHNPFIDSDITKKVDEDILNQWEAWFTEMDENGIIIYLFIYDDEIRIEDGMKWIPSESGELHEQEQYFISTLVNKFKHHKNLIWVVMEGASKINRHEEHLRKTASLIKQIDNYNHPVGISENNKLDFYEYANDANIDMLSLIYYTTNTPLKIHNMLLEAKHIARGRYNICYTESLKYGVGETMRKKNWAAAMAGSYVMVYQMNIADTALSDLEDCGRLRTFFEATNFYKMTSQDKLALGDTEYVLGETSENGLTSSIIYSSVSNSMIGVRDMSEGVYKLLWLDCKTGGQVIQDNVSVGKGDNIWVKPSEIGNEVALYINK